MTLAIPSCWDGLRIPDCQWHAAHRPPHDKVELVGGVLSVSLRTRAVRELITRLGEALAGPAAEQGDIVGTSLSGGGQVTPPELDRRLRRAGLFHEVVVGQLPPRCARRFGTTASDPPPPLVIEVLETEDDEEVELTAAAYRQGGCEQLIVVEPADPEIGCMANRYRAYDLSASIRQLEADAADDVFRLDAPIPVVLDLSDMDAFTEVVVDARRNDEL